MEENTNLTAELNADQQDAFLDGWGDEPTEVEEAADQQTEQAEEQAEQADAGEGQAAAENAEGEGKEGAAESKTTDSGEAGTAEPAGQQEAAATWTVKHMDQTRTMGVNDITPELLQKGMDYDRIRAKYDEAKPAMEMLAQFAKKAGVTTAEYITAIRAQAKQAEGMSEAEAKRAVDLEDREARVAVKEAEENARVARANEAATAQSAADQRRAAEIAEFQKTFPEAAKDPKSIPPEVWAEVKQGVSLVGAYAKYAIKNANAAKESAQREAASAKQNNKNAERSTGSMKSAGEESKSKDPFLAGWDD